ncbi:uncharacterized protein LOC143588040 [Bidens hawaiensis]|uniref:uncharacterized protein LOC143588040 n=1 Tax=Bidens hawaiensis TaxID=980011 RepID=UPI0040499016
MSLLQKRKRPESKPANGLSEPDQVVLDAIKSKGENAITKNSIHLETKLSKHIITKCIKKLKDLSMINEVKHVQVKEPHYIAADIKPSDTVSGGVWYDDEGHLDTSYIDQLKDAFLKILQRELTVTTAEGLYEFIKKIGLIINTKCTSQQVSELLGLMVLENLIIEVKSSGLGEYYSIPVGTVCYRCPDGNLNQDRSKTGALASVPCGLCPRIRECTPGGLISPATCVYYTKWLEF